MCNFYFRWHNFYWRMCKFFRNIPSKLIEHLFLMHPYWVNKCKFFLKTSFNIHVNRIHPGPEKCVSEYYWRVIYYVGALIQAIWPWNWTFYYVRQHWMLSILYSRISFKNKIPHTSASLPHVKHILHNILQHFLSKTFFF